MRRQQELEAEKTLADFKRKMEETSKKMFDDAKLQVERAFLIYTRKNTQLVTKLQQTCSKCDATTC